MRREKRRRSGLSCLVCALVGLVLTPLVASPAFAKKKSTEEPPPVYRPLTYGEEMISLLKAVELTLQNEPTILLQEEDVRLKEGIAQEETGQFDLSILAELKAEYVQQQLTKSAVTKEVEKREKAKGNLEEAQEDFNNTVSARDTVQDLNDALAANPAQPLSPLIPEEAEDALDPELLVFIALIDIQIENATGQEKQDLIDRRTRELNRVLDDFNRQSDLPPDTPVTECPVPDCKGFVQTAAEGLASSASDFLRLGAVPDDEENYEGSYNISLEKPYRSGIVLTPFNDYTLSGSNFVGKKQNAQDGGKGQEDLHKTRIGFTVDFPLGRGRGKAATGAPERAAKIDFEASRSALIHQATDSVFRTAQAYWSLRAGQETVSIFEESLKRQERLVEMTDVLIQADEIPRSELARAQARAANTRGSLESARRDLHQARLALARVIGLNVEEEAQAPLASNDFPAAADQRAIDALDSAHLAREAVDRRYDYRAAVQLRDSQKVLTRAARLNLRPIVDLQVKTFYTALAESSYSDAVDRWVGPSASVQLNLDKPIGNNSQKGRLLQSESGFRTSDINLENLGRLIKSNVVLSFGSLSFALGEVMRAEQAVAYYQQTVEAEIEKFRRGASTLIDTILTEERLTDAFIQWVGAQQKWASFLSQLRFETGTLVSGHPDESRVEEQDLFTVPFL